MASTNHHTLDIKYACERNSKKSLQYRLWRRTHEVLSAMEKYSVSVIGDIIDLGTADGRMLNLIHQKYPMARCVGIEYSKELADYGKRMFPQLEIRQGDVQSLEFSDTSFDIAIATAVIEHVPDPEKMMQEVRRVLRPGGLFILTAPDPFWEFLATLVGHLKNDQHNHVMNLRQLHRLAVSSGFTVVKTDKFMLSPVGIPFEFTLEAIVRRLHLHFMMANQLLVARC